MKDNLKKKETKEEREGMKEGRDEIKLMSGWRKEKKETRSYILPVFPIHLSSPAGVGRAG